MKLSEIARMVSGEMTGRDVEITGVSDLERQKEGGIAYAENKRSLELLSQTSVSAVIIPAGMKCETKPFITTKEPKLSFIKVLEVFSPYKPYKKEIYPAVYIEKGAVIAPDAAILPFTAVMDNAVIGGGTVIYPQVFIGKNVRIGKNCLIKAGVKIDDETVIGDNVIIHHNSVIGGDGFGYIQKDGKNIKIPQIGKIIIKDDVEIGACVTVDRAMIDDTVIDEGVKIDNLVQIAHNVKIGAHSVIMAQVGIAGSTTIGKACFLTGQVGVADHVKLGDGVIALAQSGIESKQVIEPGSIIFGSPARPMMEQKRIYAALTRLPEMVKTMAEIKKKLNIE